MLFHHQEKFSEEPKKQKGAESGANPAEFGAESFCERTGATDLRLASEGMGNANSL
jgi:hypothetical protein